MTCWSDVIRELRSDNRSGATVLLHRAADAFLLLADALPAAGEAWPQKLTEAANAVASSRAAFAGLRRLASNVLDAVEHASTAEDAARQFRAVVRACMDRLDADGAQIVSRAAPLLDPNALRAAGAKSKDGSHLRVITISASSLVERALLKAARDWPIVVTCLESRPMLEGAALARRLADAGLQVTLTVDALGPALVGDTDLVLIGGDTLSPQGLVHKVGTFGLALAARRADVPVYALVGPEKLLPTLPLASLADGGEPGEVATAQILADAPPCLHVHNPYFDRTPLELLTGIVMPAVVASPAEAARLAAMVRLHPALSGARPDSPDA
jgi:translation initiation factor 2B subunit (eIF-2B alpha/beta/delta family)